MPEHDVNEDHAVYYRGGYWNEFDVVRRMINQRISGTSTGPWFRDFAAQSSGSFKRALVLNCGNGWVEREMVGFGLVSEAVGIDYSEPLLVEARQAAAAQKLPLRYHRMNVNSADFPNEEFDLVVDHAAAHHIVMIDRVFREICRLLPADGKFLSFDYVGPHRNQYTSAAWERAWKVNDRLPGHLRQVMTYPDLPTMLHDDPTEAVHSELILEVLHRYFHVDRIVALGGPIAYPLLTHNQALFALEDKGEQAHWVEAILHADDEFLGEHPDSTLFAYFVATPNKAALEGADLLARWEQEERDREERAGRNGGEYYPRTALQDAYIRLAAEAVESFRLRNEAAALQGQLDAIKRDWAYSRLAALRESRPFTAIRQARWVPRRRGKV